MSFDKLILLDFYMRFPRTMLSQTKEDYDFEELYSFYHSNPDRENYQRIIKFLLSKKLLSKEIINGSYVYRISESGINLVSSIQNPFAENLCRNAQSIKVDISKMSEIKIQNDIYAKSKENKLEITML